MPFKRKSQTELTVLSIILIIAILLFTVRVYSIQVANSKKLAENIDGAASVMTSVIKAPRGEILDCFGRRIAINRDGYNIVFNKAYVGENLNDVIAFAKAFAKKTGAVIAITGAIDIVADDKKAYCIRNGHPMMSSITGTGCQLSAMTAAFVTANPNQPLEAAAAAVSAMGYAGEVAYSRLTEMDGNSTYRNYIIDAISNMTPEMLEKGANYEVR